MRKSEGPFWQSDKAVYSRLFSFCLFIMYTGTQYRLHRSLYIREDEQGSFMIEENNSLPKVILGLGFCLTGC